MNANHRNALVAFGLLGLAQPASADAITDWNQKVVAYVQTRMPPPQGHRATAMIHLAMFDAVNSIERRYRPYLVLLTAAPTTSKEAAAAAAATAVLTGLLPQVREEVRAALATYLEAIPNGKAKTDGSQLGEAVTAKILEARANDRAGAPDSYRPRATPGVYVPTALTVALEFRHFPRFTVASRCGRYAG
jgi:hypothetical protein